MSANVPATIQMMGRLAPASAVLAKSTVDPKSLSEGITASFPVLTYKGKVWRTKYRGEEYKHELPPTHPGMPSAGPVPTLDVVIVHSSPAISKIWYEGNYTEGDSDAPDCFSVNGKVPDPASTKKQSELCATCPKNAWGSKITEAGKQGKACQDSKRLVVVPANDLHNEMFGGPMLLRIPPASLQDMNQYNQNLKQFGHSFYSVKTQIGFDSDQAYPKITFNAIAALDDAESAIVLALQEDPRTKRILFDAVDQTPAQPALNAPVPSNVAALAGPAQQAMPVTTPAQVATPATAAAPQPAVYVPPQPAQVTAPVQQAPAQQTIDPGPIPAGLVRTPGAPTPAAQPAAAATAQAVEPFRELNAAEMMTLAQQGPAALQKYLDALGAHQAAQATAATTTRRRRTTAPTPPPSPTPTPEPAQTMTQPAPAGVTSEQDAALNDLDAKLNSLIG